MAQIKVCGQDVEIDIMDELEQFTWTKPRWSSDKLIAASPFRYDNTPSFFVSLENGGWRDSGAYDTEYESGGLPKLLAFLRDETYEETCEYLLETYGTPDTSDHITIPTIALQKHAQRITLDELTLQPYMFRHKYLANRHINERTQRFMGVGYDRSSRAVTLPWRHPDGALANLKYRTTYGKLFWYERGAVPVRSLVYGIDKVYKHKLTEVVACEAEIDALSWWSSGRPAVALGGTAVTKTQLDILRKSPIETLVLAMDNDRAGDKMQRKLIEGLNGHISLERIKVPARYKDANEALVAGVDLSELRTDNLDNLFDWNVKM